MVERKVGRNNDMYSFHKSVLYDGKCVRTCHHDIVVLDKNHFCIDGKRILVEDDSDFTYKLQKNRILAKDGAEGLIKFLYDDFKTDGPFDCVCWRIMDYAATYITEPLSERKKHE